MPVTHFSGMCGRCLEELCFLPYGVILLKNEIGLALHLNSLSCHTTDSLSGCETWIEIIGRPQKAKCVPFSMGSSPSPRGNVLLGSPHLSPSTIRGIEQTGEACMGISPPLDCSAWSRVPEVVLTVYWDLPSWVGRWQLWSFSVLEETPYLSDPSWWGENKANTSGLGTAEFDSWMES